jgi:hypothetical protein
MVDKINKSNVEGTLVFMEIRQSEEFYPFKEETCLFYIRNQSAPLSKHSASVIKTNLSMIYKAKLLLLLKATQNT